MPVCQVTGARSTVGNNVPKSNKKTKKVIRTSIKGMSFFSDIMGFDVFLNCTHRANRTILKHGGLDAYLLSTRNSSLTPDMLKLKKRIAKSAAKKGISDKMPTDIKLDLAISKK